MNGIRRKIYYSKRARVCKMWFLYDLSCTHAPPFKICANGKRSSGKSNYKNHYSIVSKGLCANETVCVVVGFPTHNNLGNLFDIFFPISLESVAVPFSRCDIVSCRRINFLGFSVTFFYS